MPRMGSGQVPSRVMVVGEAFAVADEQAGEPFASQGAVEFNRMLHEAGIMRSECFMTNVVNARPPQSDISNWVAMKKKDITSGHQFFRGKYVLPIVREGWERLAREVEMVQPDVIIALGNLAMWAVTGADGIKKWRGSQLETFDFPYKCKVIPTYHPVAVSHQWEIRTQVVNDLKRVKKEIGTKTYTNKPNWQFQLRPSYEQVLTTLSMLHHDCDVAWEVGQEVWLDFDLETRAGHIACAGISWTKERALCIPFMCVENRDGYWGLEEEATIVHALYKLLTHPACSVRWQNGLYDAQYTYRHWHFVPRGKQDTMISHHSAFAGLPKSLAFQASLYCEHYLYWKDDGKTWTKDVGEDQLWGYNCVDCVRTREVGEVSEQTIQSLGLQEVDAFQQKLFWPVLQAMQRGVRIDKKNRGKFADELQSEMTKREQFFNTVLGHQLNPNSPLQMKKLFYDDLALPPVMSRAKKGVPAHVTCDDEALKKLMLKEPLVKPIIRAIQEYRSLGVFLSTFVLAPLDFDERMRCSYNICGTETYRFNSSANAFDSGTNLQNVPKGSEEDGLTLPNVRKLFIPDNGFTFFDMDLDRADMQVVVWEANDPELKAALTKGVDMHLLNAITLAGKELPDMDWLVEGHPDYDRIRSSYKKERQLAKSFIHGTNYGGGPRTMAVAAGITTAQAERFQKMYFGKYPGIKDWHNRTEELLRTKRYVSNKFGYRRYYFDRVDGLLPEALAWVPQSTVGCYINRVWMNIFENIPEVMVLLQVHDSLAGQMPTYKKDVLIERMKVEARKVIIPYDEPLIIPVGIKTSPVSWGDCV
jgi:DNA polymerase I-like protein with 3'-5' exonuclease and polymerase domains/uracil-DNA glycosylase